LIAFLNFSDAEVRERDYFYSPAFYYFAIYIGIGAASLLGEIRNLMSRSSAATPAPVYAIAVVLLVLPMFTLKHHYYTHDRSGNYTCPVYARNMLVGLEPNAVIFTNGDNDTFPLWYIQEVEGYRTDVRVVNLSLLNTEWYIKQCRDNEPKVPIEWTDAQVDRLQPVRGKDGWLLIRDIAVRHILQTNRWERPVYFAVTIPPSTYAPYRSYLEMEGLAYKVVPREGENMVNVTRLERNVYDNFKYDTILDENWERDRSVFLPQHTEHLIQNYAAAFVQLAYIQHQDSSFDKALRSLKTAGEIAPNMEPPRQLLGLYYLDIGDTTEAIEHYMEILREDPGDLQIMYRLGGVYERMREFDKALEILDVIIVADAQNRDLVITAFQIARGAGLYERARAYAARWLERNPTDEGMRALMGDAEARMRAASPSPRQ
jgi:tetratricopeptide (TPR) repeat protein